MNHENVNSFIGAAIVLPDVYIVMSLCAKGSLQVDKLRLNIQPYMLIYNHSIALTNPCFVLSNKNI